MDHLEDDTRKKVTPSLSQILRSAVVELILRQEVLTNVAACLELRGPAHAHLLDILLPGGAAAIAWVDVARDFFFDTVGATHHRSRL